MGVYGFDGVTKVRLQAELSLSPKTGETNNNCEHNNCELRIRCSFSKLGKAV